MDQEPMTKDDYKPFDSLTSREQEDAILYIVEGNSVRDLAIMFLETMDHKDLQQILGHIRSMNQQEA